MSLAESVAPEGERILVRTRAPSLTTTGGLAVPETAILRRSARGTIVGVGPETPPELAVGREIVIAAGGGSFISALDGDEELVILNPVDVLAFLETP